jgi:hypothetical protein
MSSLTALTGLLVSATQIKDAYALRVNDNMTRPSTLWILTLIAEPIILLLGQVMTKKLICLPMLLLRVCVLCGEVYAGSSIHTE